MLSANRDSRYNLKTRTHHRLLTDADLNDCDFIIRRPMLHKSRINPSHSCSTVAFLNLVILLFVNCQ